MFGTSSLCFQQQRRESLKFTRTQFRANKTSGVRLQQRKFTSLPPLSSSKDMSRIMLSKHVGAVTSLVATNHGSSSSMLHRHAFFVSGRRNFSKWTYEPNNLCRTSQQSVRALSTKINANQKNEHSDDNNTSNSSSSRLFTGLSVGGIVLFGATHGGSLVYADEKPPPFHPDSTRYDNTTYLGRVTNMREMIDPTTLLASPQQLADAQALLKTWRADVQYSDEDTEKFWAAKKLVTATIHPVTGEEMFLPGRMSAFVPVNVPIACGMLMAKSVPYIAFWQWMNQSANMACNYANRSGAMIESSVLAQSYGLAVGCSVGMAVGMSQLTKKVPILQALGLFVPYISVCAASTANMFFTRMEEWKNGVPIVDKDGNSLGKSAKAGFEGVWQTVTTRGWVTPIPILILPPVIMVAVRSIVSGAAVLGAMEVATVAGCMYFALPYTLAIQPQTMVLSPDQLEPEFRGLKNAKGEEITEIFANKGL